MHNIKWGSIGSTGKKSFAPKAKEKCESHDEYAVAFLSNFSINNNFSHFLHALLRLFCALIDARLIIWNASTRKFVERVPYTIWLDEYFKLTDDKLSWLKSMGGTLRHLKVTIHTLSILHNMLHHSSIFILSLSYNPYIVSPECKELRI